MKFQEAPLLRYLVKTLEPLSEADPTLVAKYIIALLKNNKPKEELQKICIDQLHDFLGDGTKSFVTKLFHALEDNTILASVDDLEGRKRHDIATTVVHGDSIELRSSSLQAERLPSAVVGAFTEQEEQEGSNDEDDDRNHKHTRRVTESPSLNWDTHDENERVVSRKRGRPAGTGKSVLESEAEIPEHHKESIPLRTDREGSTKSYKFRRGSAFFSRSNVDGDQRRGSQTYYNEVAASGVDVLNGSVPRGRGLNTGPWASHDSRFTSFETVDFPSAMPPLRPVATNLYSARGILNRVNPANQSWVAFGPIPGIANGGLEHPHLLHTGLQGGRGLSLNATIGIGMGMGRPRCRDFEERGFCLRGDMCPMEHGANRIVVEDVQSLSQFNLSVSLPSRRLAGRATGAGVGPSAALISSPGSARKKLHDKNIVHGETKDSLHVNVPPTNNAVIEPDLYDPDQPLLNNGHPEGSSGIGQHGNLWNGDSSHRHSHELPDVGDDVRPQIYVASNGLSQHPVPSVWDRIGPVDCAGNKSGGARMVNSSGSQQHGKKKRKELYDDQHSYGCGEWDNDMDIDEDSGSKDVNICLQQRKARSAGVHVDPSLGSQNPAESSGHVTHEIAAHRSSRHGTERAQRTVFVYRIPAQINRTEFLLSHFQKFGEVLGINIPPNSNKAFVQFRRREDAEAALTAPDAVMGNRFIRLAWANWDSILEPGKTNATLVSAGRALNAVDLNIPGSETVKQEIGNTVPFSPKISTSEAPTSVPSVVKPVTVHDSTSSTRSALQKQETLETLNEIRHKQEILAQKREDFRRHLERLAKQGLAGKVDSSDTDTASKRQKTEVATKSSNNSCSTMKPEFAPGPITIAGNEQVVTRSTSRGVTRQIPGSRLSPAVIPQSSPKGLKQSLLSPSRLLVGPAFSPNRFKLDNRPTAFRIIPPLPEGLKDIVAVKEHFAVFGDLSVVELEGVESQSHGASKIPEACVVQVTYATRRAAERAFIEGRRWQGQSLQLVWAVATNVTNNLSRKNAPSPNLKVDLIGGSYIEKEIAGGETTTVDVTRNTDKTVAENSMEGSGQTVMRMVERGSQSNPIQLTSQLQANTAAELGGSSSVGT
eukprot:Gb_08836 [translate_table: standard]